MSEHHPIPDIPLKGGCQAVIAGIAIGLLILAGVMITLIGE